MQKEKGKEKIQPVIEGTFPVQRFYETLARILSQRENMLITVTVHPKDLQDKEAV